MKKYSLELSIQYMLYYNHTYHICTKTISSEVEKFHTLLRLKGNILWQCLAVTDKIFTFVIEGLSTKSTQLFHLEVFTYMAHNVMCFAH